MAQAYMTTYRKFFRRHEFDRRKPLRHVDKLAESLPEGDMWLIPKHIDDDGEGGAGLAEAEVIVNKMYRKRLWSSYRVHYCKDMIPKDEAEEEGGSMESALLTEGKALYSEKGQKIPPPLPTARRLYGYMRPARMYGPLTDYQVKYGKTAYGILKTNTERANKALKAAEETETSPAISGGKETGKEVKSKALLPLPPKPGLEKGRLAPQKLKTEGDLGYSLKKAIKDVHEIHPKLCICCVCSSFKRCQREPCISVKVR